jgi:hypothetical protein
MYVNILLNNTYNCMRIINQLLVKQAILSVIYTVKNIATFSNRQEYF